MLVPWERVFINGDIEASNTFLSRAPGYALLQGTIRGIVKLRFMTGLACQVAEAIGRTAAPHVQAQLGELVAKVELANGLLWACAQDVAAARREGISLRTLAATLWVFIPEAQMRAAELMVHEAARKYEAGVDCGACTWPFACRAVNSLIGASCACSWLANCCWAAAL